LEHSQPPLDGGHCVLDLGGVSFIDSTGIGFLIQLQKRLRGIGSILILLNADKSIMRALKLMRLDPFFTFATNIQEARELLEVRAKELSTAVALPAPGASSPLTWRGEIVAANVEEVWQQTSSLLSDSELHRAVLIDMSQVRFIDSSGLGLMVRVKKFAQLRQLKLFFVGLTAPVRNVLHLARLEEFLLGTNAAPGRHKVQSWPIPRPARLPENNALSHARSANKLP
jgi:anti-anti-sigma factor